MANQKIIKILPQLLTRHFSQRIINKHIVCTIGYGSGVFPQTSQNINNTVDIITIVKNNRMFHEEMINYKPNDYSGLTRYIGANYQNMLNKYIFPAHFNHIQVEQVKIKYAILDLQNFIKDLQTWKLLTFAGRLHKPVLFNILNQSQPKQLTQTIHNNYKMALNVALLNLIGKVKENQALKTDYLYRIISNLSYAGDIRHTVSVQNINKVDNIVKNNKIAFDNIYLPLIKELSIGCTKGTINIQDHNTLKIRFTPQLINKIFQKEPFPQVLKQHFNKPTDGHNYKSLTQKLLITGINYIPKQIQTILAKVNRNSSIKMAAQNFFGASLIHNLKYILAKVNKKKIK